MPKTKHDYLGSFFNYGKKKFLINLENVKQFHKVSLFIFYEKYLTVLLTIFSLQFNEIINILCLYSRDIFKNIM